MKDAKVTKGWPESIKMIERTGRRHKISQRFQIQIIDVSTVQEFTAQSDSNTRLHPLTILLVGKVFIIIHHILLNNLPNSSYNRVSQLLDH